MSNFTSITNGTGGIVFVNIAIPPIVIFWLFLISDILSLLCCLFVLYHLLFDRTLRHGLHNHVLIVLLVLCIIWELTTVPFTMNVYLFGVVWSQTPIFCMIWKFVDTSIYTTTAKLVGWVSVERHILIFHNQWISTKNKRLLIHYIPIIVIVLYGIVCYSIITPMNDCHRTFSYTSIFCGYSSCVYNSVIFSIYEFLTGGVLSSFLIGTGSISLILRTIFQKRRFHQHIQWRKHRKMIIQLLAIVSLFFVLYLPPVLLAIARKLGVPSYVGIEYSVYAQFFAYYIMFLFPFACLGTLPQLKTRINNLFRCFHQRQRRVNIIPQQ